MQDKIQLKGVRVNNLKNISLNIDYNKLICIAGLSGSGKSSLAFDTLYAEGQRRYVESLSSYARQFLGSMKKPECDYIKGLPPAIAIEQKVNSRNPRSTIGTSTEIYEYMRLLFSRVGKTYSPISGEQVKCHTVEDVVNQTTKYSKGTKYVIVAPIHIKEQQSVENHLQILIKGGYVRLWHKGEFIKIEDLLKDKDTLEHINVSDYQLLIDRLSVDDSKEYKSRLTDSIETAFYEGEGECKLVFLPALIEYNFSNKFEADGITFIEPTENTFSFNSPLGACPTCEGFGKVVGIDERLVIPNSSLSVNDGCVQCWNGEKMGEWKKEFIRRAIKENFPVFKPYFELSKEEKEMLWHGLPSNKNLPKEQRVSIDDFFQMVSENQYKIQYRVMLSRYRGKTICPDCHGTRLKKEATYVKVKGKSITELVEMPIDQLKHWFNNLNLDEHDEQIAKRLLLEINSRLDFLINVGLTYLTLNRASNSLSGGESQRIQLTTSLGSPLVGSMYILDEPSIGLHSRDTNKLIKVLKELVSIGNTVIVVEHDEEIICASDHLVDVGPDAGRLGGEIVCDLELKELDNKKVKEFPKSHTLKYILGKVKIPVPLSHRVWNRYIELKGAHLNNLKNIDVRFPLNVMTVVTGVSGSGKSSLIKGILYPALKRYMGDVSDIPGGYHSLSGDLDAVKHIEFIDQNPIGRSTRSNPATYVKAYDSIRTLFANQPLAKQLGFTPQYFSFNAEGGRCEECKGAGEITIEMQFLSDLTLECEACHGKRFKSDVLDVKYQDKNITDILDFTVSEAIDFFSTCNEKQIVARLRPLEAVGLGYIKLGQSSSTLSGGENQRVKLAYFIGQEKVEPTLFIFDEPTTGLHFHDIKRLLSAFFALIERGHSIIVIEHNMDVIKCADYVIDLGPDGGDKGGELIFSGTPEELKLCDKSITGHYLKKYIV